MVPCIHPLEDATPLTWLALSPVWNNTHQGAVGIHLSETPSSFQQLPPLPSPGFLSYNFEFVYTAFVNTLAVLHFCSKSSMQEFHFSDKLGSLWVIVILGAQPFLS